MKLSQVEIDKNGLIKWKFQNNEAQETQETVVIDKDNDGKLTNKDTSSQAFIEAAKDYDKKTIAYKLTAQVFRGCSKNGPEINSSYDDGQVVNTFDTTYTCGDLLFGMQTQHHFNHYHLYSVIDEVPVYAGDVKLIQSLIAMIEK